MIINIKCSKTDCTWNTTYEAINLTEQKISHINDQLMVTHVRMDHKIYPIIKEVLPIVIIDKVEVEP